MTELQQDTLSGKACDPFSGGFVREVVTNAA